MKARAADEVATLRIALAVLANAETVPSDAGPRVDPLGDHGLGRAEAERRELSEADVRALLEAERATLAEEARALRDQGADAAADELEARRAIFGRYLEGR
jgi:hypothetical protein